MLEDSIPRLADLSLQARSTPSAQSTSVRTLRRLLDDLTDLRTSRQRTIEDAKYAVSHDDIRPVILRKAEQELARASEQGGELKVEMSRFEEVFEREMNKFERFKEAIRENGNRQEDLLDQVKVRSLYTQVSPN